MPAARKPAASKRKRPERVKGYVVLREMEVWREDPSTGQRDIREVAYVEVGTSPAERKADAVEAVTGGEQGEYKAVPAGSWRDTVVIAQVTQTRTTVRRGDGDVE
jgi:hypothetical protein